MRFAVRLLYHAALFLMIVTSPGIVHAVQSPESLNNGSEAKGIPIQPMVAEGLPVALVYVHLNKSTGQADQDQALKSQIVAAFGEPTGGTFRELAIEMMLNKVRELPPLESADYGVYQAIPSGRVVVVIFATPRIGIKEAEKKKGMIPVGAIREFPLLYEDNRSKLTLILNGGVGVYSDTNPWFGGYGAKFNARNPLAKKPAGSGTLTWGEGYIEPGIGGISRIGDLPLYLYGRATYALSYTVGDDIYNPGDWGKGDWEQLYAGFIYDLPGDKTVIDVSFGKQIYQIREGFLLSKIPVSTSTGDRGALYLGPRLASDKTALGRLKIGDLELDAFMVEPSEVDIVKTNTRLVGTNLQYKFAKGIDTAFSFFYMADCDTTFPAPRQGSRTYNPSLWLSDIGGVDGLWFKTEYAFQDNEHYSAAAHAGYAWLGYQANSLPWKPGLSYRYAFFTGDDPDTHTNERFDPLFSGGLGNFLPGLVFSKVYKNSNLLIHRVKGNVFPSQTLELSVDYFHLTAHRTNNLGGIGALNGPLASKDIGDEITVTVSYYMGKNFYLAGYASAGIPGEAIKQAVGGDARTWYTLQTSLYMFY